MAKKRRTKQERMRWTQIVRAAIRRKKRSRTQRRRKKSKSQCQTTTITWQLIEGIQRR